MMEASSSGGKTKVLFAAVMAVTTVLLGVSVAGAATHRDGPSAGAASASSSGSGHVDFSEMRASIDKFTTEVTDYPTVPPVAGIHKLKGKTVWYVPIGGTSVLAAFGTGMKQALSTVGITLKTCDGAFLPSSVATCLQQAASQGAAGVVTGYVDYKLVPNAFASLVQQHVPVLLAGEANNSGTPNSAHMAFYDTTDSVELAEKLSMESVILDSSGKAKILYVGVLDSAQWTEASTYAKEFVLKNCPGCTFTEIDYKTAQIQKLPGQVSAALIANPATNYVVDELNDPAGVSTLQGIQDAGFTSKVKMVGFDGALDSLQRIRNKQVQFVSVGVSSVNTGWLFADGMLRMLQGHLPHHQLGAIRVFNTSNLGNLTLTPAAFATNHWYGSDNFQKTFTKAWGLS